MPIVRASMKAVVVYKNKFLLIQERLNGRVFWDLPGGTVEYGEEPLDTLNRELFEELGITVTIKKPLGVYSFRKESDADHVVCTVFVCTPVGKPVIDITRNPAVEDVYNFEWFDTTALPQLQEQGLLPAIATLLSTGDWLV